MNMQPGDASFVREEGRNWQCPTCLQSGRSLRSGSQSSSGGANVFSHDQFQLLFAELKSIKQLQQTMVEDMAGVKASQMALRNEIISRCDDLERGLHSCNQVVVGNSEMIAKHSECISLIEDRITRVESGIPVKQASPDLLAEAVAEMSDRQKRSRNVIIFGVPEPQSSGSADRRGIDIDYLGGLFSALDVACDLIHVSRLGRFSSGKCRPIKVQLSSEGNLHALIKNAKALKQLPNYQHISLSYDRTPNQLSNYRSLRAELTQRLANGEQGLKIKYVNGNPKIVRLN